MKNHCVSLELAKQLKEAGYPQEGELNWHYHAGEDYYYIESGKTLITEDGKVIEKTICAAPLATELLEQLPAKITEDKEYDYWLNIDKNLDDNKYNVHYSCGLVDYDKLVEYSGSLPDALAEMWLYLKKENLL